MGMTIDEAIGIITTKGNYSYTVIENRAKDILVDTARKYQMFQLDYEARLKDDMVAMLTEIQLEIEEKYIINPWREHEEILTQGMREANKVIQQKINVLKGGGE